MPVRYRLVPLLLLAGASAMALSCGDSSPTSVARETPALRAAETDLTPLTSTPTPTPTPPSLIACSQSYDSVTQVIGPLGGLIAVGPHYLWVDSLALAKRVSITAVAPAGRVRWVRFHPDGLVFRTNSKTGYPAIVYTDYTSCEVPASAAVRIAQVSDALGILRYLQTYVRINQDEVQFVAAVLPHFSNYAVAW
jgi:hypothetical protein